MNTKQQRIITHEILQDPLLPPTTPAGRDADKLETIALELRRDAQAYGAHIASKVAWRLRYSGNLEIAKAELSGLAVSYPRLAERIGKLAIMQKSIYEMARDAVDALNHNPINPVVFFSTKTQSVALQADGLGAVALVYTDGQNRVAVLCATPLAWSEEPDFIFDLARPEYKEWVKECQQTRDRSALSNLPETCLAGLSPRARKTRRR